MAARRHTIDLGAYVFPLIMLVIGVIAAALVAGMPQASMDVMMWRLGLPQILPAATPPIGATGRTLLALLVLAPFVAAAVLAWQWRGHWRTLGRRRTVTGGGVVTIRRADAHPDCPPRLPIRAEEDLGPPLPIITVAPARGVPEPEQPLPADLDQPLAAFDPISIPDVPRQPSRAVSPLVTVVIPPREHDASDVWAIEAPILQAPTEDSLPEPEALPEQVPEQTPPAMPAAPIPSEPDTQAHAEPEPAEKPAEPNSLAALLDRLERGAERRKAPEPASTPSPAPPSSLDDTLVMLRRMARK